MIWGGQMGQQRSVLVIDDHDIIAVGCQSRFEQAGLPWTVHWLPGLPATGGLPESDLAILDLRLADGSTPTANIQQLQALGIPVIVYTSADEPILVREAIAAGVLAIVRKSAPSNDLIEAAQAAFEGWPSARLDWASALDTDTDFVTECLTPVEAEVLALYAMGEKSGTVARALGHTENTVNTYVARIRDKYRAAGRPVDNRVALFQRAAEDGLVSYGRP